MRNLNAISTKQSWRYHIAIKIFIFYFTFHLVYSLFVCFLLFLSFLKKKKKKVKLSRAQALSETSSLNNLCVPVTKTTLLLACLPPRVFHRTMPCVCEYTYAHTLRSPPWIFDNPNWIPLLGARRRFSTVLALHRPWLSCKIVFSPFPESYEFVSPRSVENARRIKPRSFSRVRPFFQNFPPRYRPRTRGNANPPLKISKLRVENKREMASSVCFNVLLAISGGWSYLHRGQSNAGGVMFNGERGFYCWPEDTQRECD